MHLVLDSTGLQPFGQGEWDAEKHGRARRRWLKLHLAVDANTGEIAAHVLTEGTADDAAQVPALLEQVEGAIAGVTADGAEPVRAAARDRRSVGRAGVTPGPAPPLPARVPWRLDDPIRAATPLTQGDREDPR